MLFSSYSFASLTLIGCLALALNLLLGGPRSLYSSIMFLHPLNLWGSFSLKMSEKLNRFRRSEEQRRMRGAILVVITMAVMYFLADILQKFFLHPNAELLEVVLLALLLGARQQIDWSVQIEKLVGKASGSVSSEVLPLHLVRRQQREYDSATVIRGSIESMMVALSDAVVAPLFYYILFGWWGVLLVSTIAMMDSLLGYRNPQYKDFGTAIAKLHTVLQWLPSRMTGLLIATASFFAPASKPAAAFRILFTQASRTASTNAGWPIAATAGALDITLGGPRAMYGSYIADQWIGVGKVQIDVKAIKAARWLFAIAVLFLLMLLLLAAAM